MIILSKMKCEFEILNQVHVQVKLPKQILERKAVRLNLSK